MNVFYRIVRYVRRTIWAITVAFMLGLHNVYKQEHKTPDNIVITIEEDQEQKEGAPRD